MNWSHTKRSKWLAGQVMYFGQNGLFKTTTRYQYCDSLRGSATPVTFHPDTFSDDSIVSRHVALLVILIFYKSIVLLSHFSSLPATLWVWSRADVYTLLCQFSQHPTLSSEDIVRHVAVVSGQFFDVWVASQLYPHGYVARWSLLLVLVTGHVVQIRQAVRGKYHHL